jgi:hypothetical protein
MKKLVVSTCIVAFTVLLTVFTACRKPRCPEKPVDPCANKVFVNALETDYYSFAHFQRPLQGGASEWLYVTNWDEYSSKVIPGMQYKIAYVEVPCPQNKLGWCGNDGGQPSKCVKITCLEQAGCFEQPKECLPSIMNPENFGDAFSHTLEGGSITGNSFKMRIGYSGCSRDQLKDFKLALQETHFRNSDPKLSTVFLAKVVTNNDMTCQAYFEDETCFDLSTLRNYMSVNNFDLSKPVVIRMEYRDGKTQDFDYQP